jgi:gas vesicle protein
MFQSVVNRLYTTILALEQNNSSKGVLNMMTTDTMEKSETKKSGLLLGIVIGGAVGAVSALLVAPKSGTEIREDISNKYRSLNDKTQQLAATVGQKSQELADKVSNHTTDLVDKVKETKQNVFNTWQSTKDEVL